MILNSPVLASTPNVPLLVPEYRRLHMDADCELSTTGLKSSTAPLLAVSLAATRCLTERMSQTVTVGSPAVPADRK